MKEFVLVEFLVKNEEFDTLVEKLNALTIDKDFVPAGDDFEFEADTDGYTQIWWRMSGQINSAMASLVKLRDPFLADRMRISYIPEDLKNKYRR